jgi:hypothetical protein
MFSRALRASRAAPALWGSASARPVQLVKRTVTTDAASAHADKDAVPEVRLSFSSLEEEIDMVIGGLVANACGL